MSRQTKGILGRMKFSISSGSGLSRNPCIDVNEDEAGIVWVEDLDIRAGKIVNSVFTGFDFTCIDAAQECHPVVAHNSINNTTVVVYETGVVPIKLHYLVFINGSLIASDDVPYNLPGDAAFPSIVEIVQNEYRLAWRESDGVYTTHMSLSTTYPYSVQFGVLDQIPMPGMQAVGAPSITRYKMNSIPNDVSVAIASEAEDAFNSYVVMSLLLNSGQWTQLQAISIAKQDGRFWTPSISSLNQIPCAGAIDHIRCTMSSSMYFGGTDMHVIDVWPLSCGSWFPMTQNINGLHSSTVEFPMPGDGLELASLFSSSSTPKDLQGKVFQIATTQAGLNKSVTRMSAKELIMIQDTNRLTYGIGGVKIRRGNSIIPLQWKMPIDTSVPGRGTTVEEEFMTEEIAVQTGDILEMDVLDSRHGHSSAFAAGTISIQLEEIISGKSGNTRTLTSNNLHGIPPGVRHTNLQHPLAPYSGKNIRLTVGAIGLAQNTKYFVVDHYHHDVNNGTSFPKTSEQSSVELGNKRYDLSVQKIGYLKYLVLVPISANAPLNLTVTDLLGRNIISQTTNRLDGQYYHYEIDMSSLPSPSVRVVDRSTESAYHRRERAKTRGYHAIYEGKKGSGSEENAAASQQEHPGDRQGGRHLGTDAVRVASGGTCKGSSAPKGRYDTGRMDERGQVRRSCRNSVAQRRTESGVLPWARNLPRTACSVARSVCARERLG